MVREALSHGVVEKLTRHAIEPGTLRAGYGAGATKPLLAVVIHFRRKLSLYRHKQLQIYLSQQNMG